MKQIIRIALPLGAILLATGCADDPATQFAKARSSFAGHDYAKARIEIISALEQEPGNRQMLLLKARTLLALGDGSGASATIDRIAGKDKPSGELAELAAEAALLRKAPDEALAYLDGASSAESERLRGDAALQKQDIRSAGEHFARAAAAGGSARIYSDFARYKLLTGDIDGAKKLAGKAQSVSPDDLDAMLVNGQLAVRSGDLGKANDIYARAVRLYPTSLSALIAQASVLGDLGQIDKMSAVLDKVAAAAPDNRKLLYLRARADIGRKDWAAASALIQPRESEFPAKDPIRLVYGEALMHQGNFEQAIAQVGPIARSDPSNRLAIRLLAEAQLGSHDPASAVKTLRPLVDQPSARPEELAVMIKAAAVTHDPALANYVKRSQRPAVQALGHDLSDGDAAMRAGNWAGAAQAYDRILATTDGNNVMVLNNMAYAQTMLGNFDKALVYADRAVKLAPDNASVLDTAGWAHFKSGRNLAEAKRLLHMAAEKAPQNPTIRAHLAEASRTAG